ncbi:MAG: ATP-binding protein [Nitrospiraceae bacterium]|nr:ATP-binding protein [Nitrospiraceae bacterium]
MFRGWILFLFILGYLCLLFLVAYYAERRERTGRSIVSNPYVYALSLAVYCTSWTFYGSVGRAATSGISFLTTYIGPTLMASLWLVILGKIIRIAKENRITTISDFIGSRYGNSLFLSALVTVVALVGIIPYLGLQMKAIMSTFSIMSGENEGSSMAGWFIALILGIFAIIFGARRLDSSERHEGLVFAIAFESIIKLMAFLFVGIYVSFFLFGGVPDIFSRIEHSEFRQLMTMGEGTALSFREWASLLFLSMMAILFLPRQFHVAVVENSDPGHVSKAMWLFPLYLFLINVFVMPVAFGGLLLKGTQQGADNFVLTIPLMQGKSWLALFVFIGGFSAATGMVIVESVAISTMVLNNLIMPAIYKFNRMRGFYPEIIINIKRLVIFLCVFLGYSFAIYIGEFYSLVDIGLKSFEAVSIFAPALLFGLYWKRGNKKGAIAGITAGFAIWFYTLLMPALLRAGIIARGGAFSYLMGSNIFNPVALFGLKGLDRWSNSLLWGLLINVVLYIGFSLFTRQTEEEEKQALVFVESYPPNKLLTGGSGYGIIEIEDMLGQYLGRREAFDILGNFIARNGMRRDTLGLGDLARIRDEAKRVLSGALGSTIATIIFEDKLTQTEAERGELLNSIQQMSQTLRLSRRELEEVNRQLAFLKEFSENIIESLPLGVATLDQSLKVKYWNRAMEKITGVAKPDALNADAASVLSCMEMELFSQELKEREFVCRTPQMMLKGYLSRLKGAEKGYVLVFEDITEKKKIEEELFRTTKHAGIGRLAAGVAHEIGNPLASISSLVQELVEEDAGPFVKGSLLTINQHVERIARIVRNLGDFARIYPRQKVPTGIREMLGNTINLVRYDKNFRNIDIDVQAEVIPALKLDPDQMQQVFLNLILNARDAMPEGGRLSISMRQAGGFLEMAFEDTGHGMDEELKDKIFEPFFTTKGPVRGTGLGLSICYSIIKDHGGTIETVSEKGKGARFIIRLPME